MPDLVTPAVVDEWRARIVAEYTSAAITQHLVLWMIQAGAPPDLIEAGLAIVGDELVHSRLSHEVYAAAGGTAPPALDRSTLGLTRTAEPLEHDLLHAAVRVFCLGETVAVPLFAHLRDRCTVPVARAALDRILVDEVRHRDFGWDVLDWSLGCDPGAADRVAAALPAMYRELEHAYGSIDVAADGRSLASELLGRSIDVAADGRSLASELLGRSITHDHSIADGERAWGLAPPREYAEILARTFDRDYGPRFAARGIRSDSGRDFRR